MHMVGKSKRWGEGYNQSRGDRPGIEIKTQ